jgi:hypothetical protein
VSVNSSTYRARVRVGNSTTAGLVLLAIAGTGIACSFDPYERYASTLRHDVGVPSATLSITVARLQRTIVHGHVPLDSARLWNGELTKTAAVFRAHTTHLEKAVPPDTGLISIRDGFVRELGTVADSVDALNADIAHCVPQRAGGRKPAADVQPDTSGASNPDPDADCRSVVGGALTRLMKSVSYPQDELRWTLQRAGRKLATHGVLLGRSA